MAVGCQSALPAVYWNLFFLLLILQGHIKKKGEKDMKQQSKNMNEGVHLVNELELFFFSEWFIIFSQTWFQANSGEVVSFMSIN